jgi:nucleoside-diphosphate-sugar epimerase
MGQKSSDVIEFFNHVQTERMLFGRKEQDKKHIVILGGGGYLGTTLAETLAEDYYDVTVVDRFLYGNSSMRNLRQSERVNILVADIRDEEALEKAMSNGDVVVNLAAIVGDEACQLCESATMEINTESMVTIAGVAKKTGIERIIHASTCSTYGKNGAGLLKEDCPLTPLSLYAESKINSEELLLRETDGGMSPASCIFRFSTLFGYSRRPRFDLVVNTLTGHAWKRGKITIFGGNQWRPLLHVGDAARALKKAIESPKEIIGGKVYNVGGDNLNMTIERIGISIKNILPAIEIEIEEDVTDHRDYRVDFSRIRKQLDFVPEYSISNGVLELIQALDSEKDLDPDLPVCSNYKWLNSRKELLQTQEIAVPVY